jgi:hypothetical protein
MNVGIVILVIAAISVGLALRSLKQLSSLEEIEHVQEEMKKGRVIFQNDSSSS